MSPITKSVVRDNFQQFFNLFICATKLLYEIFNPMYTYSHNVQFYETDLMGVVHHANYLRFFEEARVAWARSQGLIDYQKPESAAHFAVIETKVTHLKPAKFGDVLQIKLQVKRDGVKITFQYKMFTGNDLISTAETIHVPLDKNLKPIKVPTEMKTIIERETWIETWL